MIHQKRLPIPLLAIRALFALLRFDVNGLGQNFAALHASVSSHPVSLRQPTNGIVGSVCDAVNSACMWYPKRVLCLQRSIVTTCLLRDCGVKAMMLVGIQSLPFKAHAWTEVDGQAINEHNDVQRVYSVIDRC
jgi:transglutaminase superfamily protein